jgi:hypothetical protein
VKGTSSPLPHLLYPFQIPTYHYWTFYTNHHVFCHEKCQTDNLIYFCQVKTFLMQQKLFLTTRVKHSFSKAYKTGKIVLSRLLIPVVYAEQSKIQCFSLYIPQFIYCTKQLHVAAIEYSQHRAICKIKMEIFL